MHFAGDSLSYHNGCEFTTKDRDNDARSSSNWAVVAHGAWWYNTGHHSNLNGRYINQAGRIDSSGLRWYHWKGNSLSMKHASMKIRPNN